LLAKRCARLAAASNLMTLNYCQAGARFPQGFPQRFKVALHVEA
jgi:hypothetical protein